MDHTPSRSALFLLPALASLANLPHANEGFVECTRIVHEFPGETAGDQFGWVSAPIPDLDGDGACEIAITAPTWDAFTRGRLYVYSGRTGALLWSVAGAESTSLLGQSVAAAGDVDMDGTCDIVAGAPGPGGAGVAATAVVFSGVDGSEIWTLSEGGPASVFGASVAGLGDVNGDGHADIAVGAPGANASTGRVRVLSGIDGTTVLFDVKGEFAGDRFGAGVGNTGDVTGDGVADLVIGAPNAGPGTRGKAYVYNVVTSALVWDVDADATGANLGQFFAVGVGDVNADGTPDVYVGDFNDSENGPSAGKMYVFDGATGAPIWVIPGDNAGDGFGIGRGAGDVNGDGHADLLMCGWQDSDGAFQAGAASVISGADGSVLRKITSTTAGETFGFDAHGVGDVDGDGRIDYFVTAAWNDESGGNAGRCYLIAGGAPVSTQGAGLAGTGGFVPAIDAGGCPELDVPMTVEIADGLGGASGFVVFGTEISVPFFGGTLGVLPVGTAGHVLAGGVLAGEGTASLPFQTPADPALTGVALFLQGLYVDAGAPFGVSLTPTLRLIFG